MQQQSGNKLMWVDLDTMSQLMQADRPVLIESAVPDNAVVARDEYPLPKRISDIEQFHVMPETHLMYAATWYCLALFGGIMVYTTLKKPNKVASKRITALLKKREADAQRRAAIDPKDLPY